MTAYFDTLTSKIQDVPWDSPTAWDDYGSLEQDLVFDCTVAAMFPAFPEDLRLCVHRAILKGAVQHLPRNAPPADFEHNHEYGARLRTMTSDLHDVFHELARRGIPGFGDSPKAPLRHLYDDGDEIREQFVKDDDNG